MCTFNLEIEDDVVSRIRPSFKDDAAIKVWMQEQLVLLMMQYNSSYQKANPAKMDFESALSYIKSLAVPGGKDIPANVSGIDCLIDEKYT